MSQSAHGAGALRASGCGHTAICRGFSDPLAASWHLLPPLIFLSTLTPVALRWRPLEQPSQRRPTERRRQRALLGLVTRAPCLSFTRRRSLPCLAHRPAAGYQEGRLPPQGLSGHCRGACRAAVRGGCFEPLRLRRRVVEPQAADSPPRQALLELRRGSGRAASARGLAALT